MKNSILFEEVFGKPLKLKKLKKWYPTKAIKIHKNKKKEASKNACRNWKYN